MNVIEGKRNVPNMCVFEKLVRRNNLGEAVGVTLKAFVKSPSSTEPKGWSLEEAEK